MIHSVAFALSLCCIVLNANLEVARQVRATGNREKTIEAFEFALAQEPTNPDAYYEYAYYLIELDEQQYYDTTITVLSRACELKDDLQWHFLLGCQACRYGYLDLSINAYRRILDKYPGQLSVFYNLGYTLKCKEHLKEAIAIYESIIQQSPDYEAAHLGLAFALIGLGDFQAGWKEHEWNLKKQGKFAAELRTLLQHNAIAGKTILLNPEGGLGDSINFLRYVQKLKHMGAHTIVSIQSALIPLLSRCDYIDQLIPTQSNTSVRFHAFATLMSLAPIFCEKENAVLQNIPYIFADPERVSYWHEKLKHDTNFKIGICWQPSIHNDVSRLPIARRGIPLPHFFKLGATPGITLYSLQCVEGLEQLSSIPKEVNLVTFDEHFDKDHGSFVDTAALMHELDLIISADTATAHLAGAMGRPVWLLLPYVTDWRWLVKRTDSPWYPTMRIFKQPKPFDWHSAIEELYDVFFNEVFKTGVSS